MKTTFQPDTLSLGSSPSSFSPGQLVGLQVERFLSSRNAVVLRSGGETFHVASRGPLPEGALLLGRVQRENGRLEIQLLSGQDVRKLTDDELLRFLRSRRPAVKASSPEEIRRQLRHRGFLQPAEQHTARHSSVSPPGSGPDPDPSPSRSGRAPFGHPRRPDRARLLTGELDRDFIRKLLTNAGLPGRDATVEAVNTLLRTVRDVTRREFKALVGAMRQLPGEPRERTAEAWKALLFLIRADKPPTAELVDELVRTSQPAPESNSPVPAEGAVQPEHGDLESQLRSWVQRQGVEGKRILSQPPSTVLRILRGLFFNPGERKGKGVPEGFAQLLKNLIQSGQAGSEGASSRSESNEHPHVSQALRQTLASSQNDNRYYLFFPFVDGGRERLMHVRFQDEREDPSKQYRDRWTVSLELELSQLGSIRVNARRRRMNLRVQFLADEKETRQMLRRRQEGLTEALTEMGYSPVVQTSVLSRREGDFIDRDFGLVSSADAVRFDVTV